MFGCSSANRTGTLLVFLAGCAAQDVCVEEATACGGDPVGVWNVDDSCRAPFFLPPQRLTYFSQPIATESQPPPEPTSSDWCSNLQYEPGRNPGQKITLFTFAYDALAVTGGTLRYQSDGTYRGIMLSFGRGVSDISASCLTRFGAQPSCSELGSELAQYAASQPSFRDIACEDGSTGGCRCTYTLSFDGSYTGRFMASGGTLTHFDSGHRLPSRADYCVGNSGNSLTIWGQNQATVLDSPPGLRTIHLSRKNE